MTPRISIYDRISERRLAEQKKQHLSDAAFPKGNFASDSVNIVRAWVWLPCGSFDAPLPASELAGLHSDFSHDLRLLDARGGCQPIRRLAAPAAGWPEVEALGRSGEILQAALNTWAPAFRDSIDWRNTQVVLFVPSAVRPLDWLDRVLSLWPTGLLPQRGFELQTQTPAQWLPEVLAHSAGAQYLLCLSLDTWACQERTTLCTPGEVAGEAVSAVLLRRQSKQAAPESGSPIKLFAPIKLDHLALTSEARTDTQTLERLMAELVKVTAIDPARVSVLIGDGALDGLRLIQVREYARDFLPSLSLERQICLSTLGARFGPVTEQWVQISLAWLTASAEPNCAVWILDGKLATQTQGWLIG
jgi:hypothetical protein